jgi:hypothetical protein
MGIGAQLSQVRWGRIFLAAAAAAVLSMVLLFLVVTAYAMSLAIQVRGAPDQAQIERFASQVGAWLGPALSVLFTVLAAAWAARGVQTGAKGAYLHGLLVGLAVAAIGLIAAAAFGGPASLDIITLAGFVLAAAAGLLGGWLGSKWGRPKGMGRIQGTESSHS